MPSTQNAANPFFGNIRQNMDLIGGVGQLSLKHPQAMTKSVEEELPEWLKGAADQSDHGKTVADKFLHIEKREQKRMQEALSSKVILGNPPLRTDSAVPIQIAGMENGAKNRYNNIWPYEHSRVKLQNSEEGSDYVNANHIRTSMSNKQYIATQGPLPATFSVSIPSSACNIKLTRLRISGMSSGNRTFVSSSCLQPSTRAASSKRTTTGQRGSTVTYTLTP